MVHSATATTKPPIVGSLAAPVRVPVVFGDSDRALFGLFHPAQATDGGEVCDLAFVLCNPLGYEAMCAHTTYRHLAERFAAKGIAALRFDYLGTGDSSGNGDEPDRVDAWLQSISAAAAKLKILSGARRLGFFGVRFGGSLAAFAAAARDDVDTLMLWAPMATGREVLRELRAFRMIKQAADDPGLGPNGGEEAAGYHFDRQTVEGLARIDLLQVGCSARRVLIVTRDNLPGSEARIATHFARSGADVRLAAEPGYARMMRDPQETIVPGETLEKMVEWAGEGVELQPLPAPQSMPPGPVFHTTTPGRRASVLERAVRFGPGNRLFGVVTEPIANSSQATRPAVLFLNVGANHHVGPNRMYVTTSRDLAAYGYLCFRFDVSGLGDSKITPGAKENRLYSKDSVGDVKRAMDFIQEQYSVGRFALAGLCSGAYLAFHTCVEDPRVVAQILMNPQTFEWKDGDSLELSTRNNLLSTRHYLRALFEPSVWRRMVKGQVNVSLVVNVLRDRLVSRSIGGLRSLAARATMRREELSEVAQAFEAASDRGVDTLLIFSFSDGGLDMIESHLGSEGRRMKGRKNFRLAIVDGADHTFTPIDSQLRVRRLIVRHVVSRLR
jgi:pimeloyl-ACP methyl ester carboxylesterase